MDFMLLILCVFIHPIHLPTTAFVGCCIAYTVEFVIKKYEEVQRNDNIWHYLHIHVQAGLVLCHGNIPEKNHADQTKLPFKTVYFLGVRGLKA